MLAACHLGLQHNISLQWETGLLGNLALLQDPQGVAHFFSIRWCVGTNPDLAFASVGWDNRLPDRRVLEKSPRSRHRPSLIMPPKLKVPVYSDPVKRGNFRKADWKCFWFLTRKSVERLSPADTTNIEKAYQKQCESLLFAAQQCIPLSRSKNCVPCWDKECETLYRSFLRAPVETDFDRATSSLLSRLDDKKQELWEEAVNSIDFSHSSRKAWSTINKPWKATFTRIAIFKWGAIVWRVSWLTALFITFLVNPLTKSSSVPWFRQRITQPSSIYISDFLTKRLDTATGSFDFNVDFVVTILILPWLSNIEVGTGERSWLKTVFIMMSLD